MPSMENLSGEDFLLANPRQRARSVAFVAPDLRVDFPLSPAAHYITGTTVTIDGGLSLTVALGA